MESILFEFDERLRRLFFCVGQGHRHLRFFYHLIQNQVGKGLNRISEENFFHQTQQKVNLSAHTATLPGGVEEEQMEIHSEEVYDVCF